MAPNPNGIPHSSPGLAQPRERRGLVDNPEWVVELGYDHMPQSLSRIYLHLIFSTKNRERCLVDADLRKALHAYVASTMKQLDCVPVEIGGVEDHIHILCLFPRTYSVADVVKETKRVSTDWLQQQAPEMQNFHWQAGYGVFSVSQSNVRELVEYIRNQKEHHLVCRIVS